MVREDLLEAHRLAWEHIATAGSWWSGAERVELAGNGAIHIDGHGAGVTRETVNDVVRLGRGDRIRVESPG